MSAIELPTGVARRRHAAVIFAVDWRLIFSLHELKSSGPPLTTSCRQHCGRFSRVHPINEKHTLKAMVKIQGLLPEHARRLEIMMVGGEGNRSVAGTGLAVLKRRDYA